MSKRACQYIGIFAAVAAYYIVHEGAHLLYALFSGSFRQINFMGLGVQIDVYAERMTDAQLGVFCLVARWPRSPPRTYSRPSPGGSAKRKVSCCAR